MIDFHCHLDLYPEPHQIVKECIVRKIYVLSVTTTPSAWAGTSALVKDATRIRTAIGLHPQLAHLRRSEFPLFEQLLPQTRYVGEIGLDGTPEFKPFWADQSAVFVQVLDACRTAGGRILSIHSRRAATAVLDALAERRDAGTPVLHWFSGSARELARASDLQCWFSVGPAMLASEKGRMLVAKMPRDRLITETDGPFAQEEGRPAMPWDAERAVIILSHIWNESSESAKSRVTENFRRLVTP